MLSMKNKYIVRSRISKAKFREILKYFCTEFKGIKKDNFLLHLKECEFRYNNGNNSEILYQKLLKLIRKNPLKLN